jgi:hypothetical protein
MHQPMLCKCFSQLQSIGYRLSALEQCFILLVMQSYSFASISVFNPDPEVGIVKMHIRCLKGCFARARVGAIWGGWERGRLGYCSSGASGAKMQMALGEEARDPGKG